MNEAATSIPVGTGILGEVAATGQVIIRRKCDAEWKALNDSAWLKRERIESFVATPITFKDEVLGVIAAFLRHAMLTESLPYGHMFGNYIGDAVANARAFEEIQRLKTQLEQQNAYFEEEVLEARAFGDLIGQSGALRQIVGQVDLVAPTDAVKLQTSTATEDDGALDDVSQFANKANWKIKGPDGAAELLGVKPTTLLSRIKKWGFKKPAAS